MKLPLEQILSYRCRPIFVEPACDEGDIVVTTSVYVRMYVCAQ